MSEPKVFLLPDLGEGLTEAELVNWLVAVGDEIRVDQPIAEVETAKSMVEVPSPYAGTVAVLHGEPGQTLDVGKPLISVMPVGVLLVGPPRMMPPPPLRRTAFVLRTMLPAPDRPDATPGAASSASAGVAADSPGCCCCRDLPRGGEGWVWECLDRLWDSGRAWGCPADTGS